MYQDINNKKQQLLQINKQIDLCKNCDLCKTATNPVYGTGNCNAQVVFIGEAPGAKEDELGLPFVGRSGKLLDSLLKEINYNRNDVWIGNIVKHRPPNNRDPKQSEIKACEGFLKKQLQVIKPSMIITLGRHALNYFVPNAKISLEHGKLVSTDQYNIYPLYHPAAGIRNGNMLKLLKQDFLKIPDVLKNIN